MIICEPRCALQPQQMSSHLGFCDHPLPPLWWSAVHLMSPWSHVQPWYSSSALDWWLWGGAINVCLQRKNLRFGFVCKGEALLPSTLCETLGSRKLSGSSSSPSLSHARPLCRLSTLFLALFAFPSSSDDSLSDSARMSSILEKRTQRLSGRFERGQAFKCLVRIVVYLSFLALGTSSSLSESSSCSAASLRLLVQASALRIFTSTLWCSAGSMVFTSSKLRKHQQVRQYI